MLCERTGRRALNLGLCGTNKWVAFRFQFKPGRVGCSDTKAQFAVKNKVSSNSQNAQLPVGVQPEVARIWTFSSLSAIWKW